MFYHTWVSLWTHSVLVTVLLSLRYNKEYCRTDLQRNELSKVHTLLVLPDPALRLTVGVQAREATVSVLRAVHQPPWFEALKVLLCRPELREGEEFSQGCPAHHCRLLGLLGLPLRPCGQPHCLVFASLAGTQGAGRLQMVGCCLWELCCTFYPVVPGEGPRDGGPEKDLARQVLLHVPSLHLSLSPCLPSTQV